MNENLQIPSIEKEGVYILNVNDTLPINGDELIYAGLNKWGEIVFKTAPHRELRLAVGSEISREVVTETNEIYQIKFCKIISFVANTSQIEVEIYPDPIETEHLPIQHLEW